MKDTPRYCEKGGRACDALSWLKYRILSRSTKLLLPKNLNRSILPQLTVRNLTIHSLLIQGNRNGIKISTVCDKVSIFSCSIPQLVCSFSKSTLIFKNHISPAVQDA